MLKNMMINKRIAMGVALLMAAITASAGIDDKCIAYSTTGIDRYADGTRVLDGECYALVWSPNGKVFSGFNADGTAASALDRVILAAPLALDGRCRDSLFQIPAAEYDALEGGTWAVCLVDTRRANGVPAGVKDGKPVRVNRWGLIEGGVTIKPAGAGALNFAASNELARRTLGASVSGGVRASLISSVPAGTKSPRIIGFTVQDGIATLSVADTDPCLTYTIESGYCPDGSFFIDDQADIVDGDTAGEIVLETSTFGKSRFFKVTRAEF